METDGTKCMTLWLPVPHRSVLYILIMRKETKCHTLWQNIPKWLSTCSDDVLPALCRCKKNRKVDNSNTKAKQSNCAQLLMQRLSRQHTHGLHLYEATVICSFFRLEWHLKCYIVREHFLVLWLKKKCKAVVFKFPGLANQGT